MYLGKHLRSELFDAVRRGLRPVCLIALFFVIESSAAVLTVNSTGDASDINPGDGVCSSGGAVCTLRAAIEESNALVGTDLIEFNIPGAGVQTIAPLAPLPEITSPVVIDGYTQPGASPNTNPTTAGSNAVLLIELNGANAGPGADGIRILSGNSTVRGLVINRFSDDGIAVNDGDSNIIEGNFIGTDPTGLIDLGNGGDGFVTDSSIVTILSNLNTIGGLTPAARNVISGNGANGINMFFGSGNFVRGNIVGLAADGITDLGNEGAGIISNFSSNNTIGGAAFEARNIVSGNRTIGIVLQSGGGVNFIQGNYVGTDVSGTVAVGNGTVGVSFNVRSNDVFGGANSGEGNLISGNGGHGVQIGNSDLIQVSGNFIGIAADGVTALGNGGHGIYFLATAENCSIGVLAPNVIAFNSGDGIYNSSGTGNAIRGNSIYSNGGLGIDLGANGVTPNDADDADKGPNELQNFPVIASVVNSSGSINLSGSLNSAPDSLFTLDFYASETCDASMNGEGQIYIGSAGVSTNGTGNGSFSAMFSVNIPVEYLFTVTATDALGNTSEFSTCASAMPTAAGVSLSGRTLTADGRAANGIYVILTDEDGEIRQTRTNSFGRFSFSDLPAGRIYVLSIKSKTYTSAPQVLFLTDDLDDFEIVVH
jgi:CSLREA domain-containing protein